jgi:anti-sigma-K factor RskA
MTSVLQQIERSERDPLTRAETKPEPEEKSETATVIPLEKSSSRWNWRTVSIAASVLLLVSLGLNWLFFQRWQNTEGQLAGIIAERNQLAQERETLQTSLSSRDQLLAHINDPGSKEIQISGAPLEKEGRATVIWNPESHQVLLANYVLPEPPEGKQYQLWALYGSEPRDAGIFDQDSLQGFMKSIDGAPTAFAISLEKVGGSPSPTEVWAVGVVEG